MSPWHHISYPPLLSPAWALKLWARWCCRWGWHLWDEGHGVDDAGHTLHQLYCDACGLTLTLKDG